MCVSVSNSRKFKKIYWKATKKRVREWVKDNVGRRNSDAILWGRWEKTEDRETEEERKE